MSFQAIFKRWIKEAVDEGIATELRKIAGDNVAIEDRFYRDLEFGTGGLRGVMGAGTNRMNIYIVRKASQGYAIYLKKTAANPSVAIAYDSRNNSEIFAKTAAEVFAGNGIAVHIYSRLMPTPTLSFAVRDLKCDGGVVITASHNPAIYNGYKVYGHDGCQITTQAANAIQTEIDRVDPFDDVKRIDFEAALVSGMVSYIGDDTVDRYLAAVGTSSILPADIPRDVAIVYTPLNGTGISCVPRCLKEHGFTNITIPTEQRLPDGNFPTCPYPNPEIREALTVGLNWAEKSGSDLLLATDPDCDRVGAAVRTTDGYSLITGNEMGVLLLDFICRMRIANNAMPKRPVAVKTIVTTPMASKIANKYGVELIDVLTGFKFIGEQIGLLEKCGEENRYVFGFEESYGYLSGCFVRDKDAVNASLLICEMFAYYKAQSRTLIDVLNELYMEFGFFESRLLNFSFEGISGYEKMQNLMNALRTEQPREIAGYAVKKCVDYKDSAKTGLPSSNVLRYILTSGLEATVRPSGTEPKLKVYLTAVGRNRDESRAVAEKLVGHFNSWVKT